MASEVKRKKMTEDEMSAALLKVRFEDCISNGLYDCDFIFETSSENFDIKKRIYEDLQQYSSEDSIIASNSSSIPVI